ncbi:MAG: type III pantothenate kinase [Firmicutes bacterium]|nr:type III pantothenate kinase [Bacillota bacterium]
MIIAIDVGNTHLVIGCIDEGGARHVGRFQTNTSATAEEYAIRFKTWFDLSGIDSGLIDGAIIATVVPPLVSVLRRAIRLLIGKDPLVVGPGIRSGLNIKTDNPAQVGADMVAGAVASIAKYPLPQIVFDLGTATTASIIDQNGVFRGAIILAGVRTALETLTRNTSQLPAIDLVAPRHVIGTNTVDSMRSGSVFGTAAMMDGLADRIEEELGCKTTLVATGGLSSAITAYCKHHFIQDDDLVLDGLWIIYQRNQNNGERKN